MAYQSDPSEFDFPNLNRVLPIAQSCRFDDCLIAVLSIEVYRAGFIIILEYEYPSPGTWSPKRAVFNVSDDEGQRYIGNIRSGYGGIRDGLLSSREVVMFKPALSPTISSLTVEAVLIDGTTTLGFEPGAGHFYPSEAVTDGPWSMSISLDVQSAFRPLPPTPGNHVFPTYTMEHFQGVIPTPQQQRAGDCTLTMYSLERYRDGFIVVMREDFPTEDKTSPRPPKWKCLDDLGNPYTACCRSGSGSLPLGPITTWRVDHQFWPAIDPLAKQLSFRLDAFGKTSGPWEFEVKL